MTGVIRNRPAEYAGRPVLSAWARWVRRFLHAPEGSIALKFALVGTAVIMLGAGAIDLLAVHNAKTRLQAIADAAALSGAPVLALATDDLGARERAASFVRGQMAEWVDAPSYEATYEVVTQGGQRGLRVLLRGNRPSFFANMLPPGGWFFIGDATASAVGLVPLCVLVTGETGSKVLNVLDAGRMSAPACLVHSNRDIEVEGGSIRAAMVHAATSARGVISPTPNTGAARIEDPFLTLDVGQAGRLRCSPSELATGKIVVTSGTHYIPPGRHCGGIEAGGAARIALGAGDHHFIAGALVIKEGARLEGQDVVLLFDATSKFEFKDNAVVNLAGRTEGPFTGIVMGASRDNRQDFIISADNVDSLLGVIYVPSARLIVEGSAEVAQDSAWTVIVAKEMQMKGTPSLIINANYSASSVPVPSGVGNRVGGSRLID